jgi:hypothetical protein
MKNIENLDKIIKNLEIFTLINNDLLNKEDKILGKINELKSNLDKSKGTCQNAISSRKYRLNEKIRDENLNKVNHIFNSFID